MRDRASHHFCQAGNKQEHCGRSNHDKGTDPIVVAVSQCFYAMCRAGQFAGLTCMQPIDALEAMHYNNADSHGMYRCSGKAAA